MHRFAQPYFIYLIPMLLAAVLSLRVFIEKWPAPYRIFSALLFATLVIEFGAIIWMWDWHYIFGWNYSDSNIWLYNAGLLVRLILTVWFYHNIIESPRVRKLIRWIGGLALLLLIAVYIGWPHNTFVGYFLLFNTVSILLAVLYFRQLLKNDEVIRLEKDPGVWISIGTLIYSMANLPVFTFIDYLVKTNTKAALDSLYYNDALNILSYTLFLIAFLCKPQPKPLPSSSSSPHY
ncbi:hypothetical protein [Terrimonas ferruginea]|uniref:hypothetical protein n=1 Tax=Terrimonas ferruginea TaxID=249 RepID=UPI00048C1EBA|nr:hypothetical protein [Terrimonas ferruginea]